MYGSFGASSRGRFATPDDISRIFKQHQPELEWYAYLITGDECIAKACVVEARASSVAQVFENWLLEWARYATIRAAIEAQRKRRMLLGSEQDYPPCSHTAHELIDASMIEFLVPNTDVLIKRLDALSRVALVVHGIEKHSLGEAAIFACVSPKTLRAAYCAALGCVQVLQYEAISRVNAWTSLRN